MDLSDTVLAVDVPRMVESLASLGLSTVDLLCAVRLHARCSLREARQILADLAPAVQDPDLVGPFGLQEFEPGSAGTALP